VVAASPDLYETLRVKTAGNQQASVSRTAGLSGYNGLSPDAQQAVSVRGATADLNDATKLFAAPEVKFETRLFLTSLDVIANRLGRKLGGDKPFLNAQLRDGSRLAAVIR
jgi:hypothetical protein